MLTDFESSFTEALIRILVKK